MFRTALALTCTLLVSLVQAAGSALDTAAIENATGLKGTYSEAEKVFKVTKPRDDIKVEVDRWPTPPFMGLSSWAAFTPMGNQVMVMGDTVLFEDEVNPAMSAALDAGLEVTALHNHFFFDRPRVYFMHIAGMGDARRLGAAVKAMYDSVAKVRAAQPAPENGFPGGIGAPSSISAAPIEAILGSKAQTKEGMVKVTIGRKAEMHGVSLGNEMGVNTWAAFAGTDDRAVVDGDFAMHENELQAVLKSMRKSGLNIVAIHQHMTGEQPRIMFLHYWGKGKAQDLARAVKLAVDSQAPAKGR